LQIHKKFLYDSDIIHDTLVIALKLNQYHPIVLLQVRSMFIDEVNNFEKSHEVMGFQVGINSVDFSDNQIFTWDKIATQY